jgi:hypothetical protein
MVFSLEKWNNGRELQRVIKGSAAMDWVVFSPVLSDAFSLFIRPLLDDGMTDRLVSVYRDENQTEEEKELIRLAQRANANLAVWYNFNELNTVLSSSGTQRYSSESYQSLYKYQERSLRDGYKTKGFDALDHLLAFLERKVSDYPEFRASKAYRDRRLSFVGSAEEINRYLPIENSRLIYLRFFPHLQFVEQTKVKSFIGEPLFLELKKEVQDEKGRGLIEMLRPVIVCLAAERVVRYSGSITDKGLYFSSILAGISGNDETSQPADPAIINSQAMMFVSDAKEYMALADRYIREHFQALYRGTPGNELNVDNDGRKIFWA